MIVHSQAPLNAEPPLDQLRARFVTPNEWFYIRNHGEIPQPDGASFRLAVNGMVERPLELSLDRLLNDFPKRTVMATLECAGNRRQELIEHAPIPGETPWQAGAIGNAFWSGVPLKEVLNAAGIRLGAQYVAMQGADDVWRKEQNVGFGGSIPLTKALSGEVLLAYEMNGKPLEPAHGFPLRVITPGYIGARSVKWLTQITVQASPSQNYFQAHAYQLFPPHTTAETADWNAGLQLGELAVNCVICSPRGGESVSGQVPVEGYAVTGGDRRIARVDVSADEGATWSVATLTQGDQPFVWTLWQTQLELSPGAHTILARAMDTAANTQPERVNHIWNFKGYMHNAWHGVRVTVQG